MSWRQITILKSLITFVPQFILVAVARNSSVDPQGGDVAVVPKLPDDFRHEPAVLSSGGQDDVVRPVAAEMPKLLGQRVGAKPNFEDGVFTVLSADVTKLFTVVIYE
jgi:hypothetical protein